MTSYLAHRHPNPQWPCDCLGEDDSNCPLRDFMTDEYEAHARRVGWRFNGLDVNPNDLQPHPARTFKKLRETISKLRRETDEPMTFRDFCLTINSGQSLNMGPDDWAAFAELIISIPNFEELRFSWRHEPRAPSVIPPSFLLSLRQHCFDLELRFLCDDDPTVLLSNLIQQGRQVHHPAISPYALGAITLESIEISHVWAFLRLGRAGPDTVILSDQYSFYGEREGYSNDALMARLEKNAWLRWEDKKGDTWERALLRVFDPDIESDDEYQDASEVAPVSLDLARRMDALNIRNHHLCVSTQIAAASLLQAARPLVFSLSVATCKPRTNSLATFKPPTDSHPTPDHHASNPLISGELAPSTSTSDSPSSSSPARISPILSIPYDVLDTILSHVSPGCLSSAQHRLVMAWAEDRCTLRPEAEWSDFIITTNCLRWESEYESVNSGSAFD